MTELVGPGTHLLAIVAHPDDESFGCGSVLAAAGAASARVTVCSATLGERGEPAPGFELAGRHLADVRHDELRLAAEHLGVTCLEPLGLLDSGWDGPAPAGSVCALSLAELAARVDAVVAEHCPDVVLTIAGDDGHRDHQRLAEAVRTAVGAHRGPHLYQWCLPNDLMRRWADETARLRPDTAHLALELATLGTPAERITDVLDTSAQLATRRAAIAAHASQTSPYEGLSPELAEAFLTRDHLIRLS